MMLSETRLLISAMVDATAPRTELLSRWSDVKIPGSSARSTSRAHAEKKGSEIMKKKIKIKEMRCACAVHDESGICKLPLDVQHRVLHPNDGGELRRHLSFRRLDGKDERALFHARGAGGWLLWAEEFLPFLIGTEDPFHIKHIVIRIWSRLGDAAPGQNPFHTAFTFADMGRSAYLDSDYDTDTQFYVRRVLSSGPPLRNVIFTTRPIEEGYDTENDVRYDEYWRSRHPVDREQRVRSPVHFDRMFRI
jgi:hypothetical protein